MVKAKVIQIEKRYNWDKLRGSFVSGPTDDLEAFLRAHNIPDNEDTWNKTFG